MSRQEFIALCCAYDESPKVRVILDEHGRHIGEFVFHDGRVFHWAPGEDVIEATSETRMSEVLVRHRLRQPMN
jgi:hypothetical protein